ncbi:hypothetical protein RND15_51000, partial [Streptomyces sp. DSM 41529]|nr:hypothetical protein [Streptomyces sp. DSM 41529]
MIAGRPGEDVPPIPAPQVVVLRRLRTARVLVAGLLTAGLTVAAGPPATATAPPHGRTGPATGSAGCANPVPRTLGRLPG